ncbi:hypothetical protein [Streptomyces sp. NBC_01363]|uniref:hypothetical protein n=1 Tax=Streptomyces sp. NBC_01363 TaxID=2903840 RepID=UPI00224CD8A3|nr:hypothetical protein [Streptomyces sp. NBC_01363]MCX4731511.1 hypothetical protein [Streptomyces sp. NBC_01363]
MSWRTIISNSARTRLRRSHRQPSGGSRESEWQLERRISQLLRTLNVRPPLDVKELCQALSQSRGRHIELRSYPLPPSGPIGLWLETANADLILFQRDTTPLHQDHIILHEVGHILADHRGAGVDTQWDALLPGLEIGAIRRALQRSSYGTEQEHEAELIATIILEWASVLDRVMPSSSDDHSTQRIQDVLGDKRGWL